MCGKCVGCTCNSDCDRMRSLLSSLGTRKEDASLETIIMANKEAFLGRTQCVQLQLASSCFLWTQQFVVRTFSESTPLDCGGHSKIALVKCHVFYSLFERRTSSFDEVKISSFPALEIQKLCSSFAPFISYI